MIYLNILSKNDKRLFKFAQIDRVIGYYMFIIISVMVGLFLIFFGAKYLLVWYLSISKDDILQQESINRTEDIRILQGKIEDANGVINKIKAINNSKIEFSVLLDNLSGIISDDIILSRFSSNFDKKGENINFSIEGIANQRKDFLDFIGELEGSSYFKKVNSPPSNLVKKDNINFRITFQLE